MQITRLEVELGVTVNAGDFQSVKAAVKACADIDRNEDPMEAHAKLAAFVRQSLVDGARDGHPDQVRKMLTADVRLSEAAQGNAEAAKRTRRTKEQIAADEAAKTAAKGNGTAKLAETTGMDVGGLDKEGDLDKALAGESGAADDDLDALLGVTEEAVTREQVQEALTRVMKKCGKPSVLELLKKHGAASLGELPDSKFAAMKKDAEAAIASAN